MKKIIVMLLVVMLCMSLWACEKDEQNNDFVGQLGGSQDQPDGGNDQQDSQNAKEPPLVFNADFIGGDACLNVTRLPEIVEEVQLTTENWRDCIKVYTYTWDEVKTEKDAFGEVISTETITHSVIQLGADNTRYHCFEDAVIELKNKSTGESITFQFSYGGSNLKEVIDLGEYECTRIKGYLYFIDIPEEVIMRSNGLVYFDMGTPMIDSSTGEIEGSIPYAPTTEIDPKTNAIQCSYWSVSKILEDYS